MRKPIFLLAIIFLSLTCFSQGTDRAFSSFEQAKQHPVFHEGPAPDFFEGALIGNGGLGAVVCTRPDAVVNECLMQSYKGTIRLFPNWPMENDAEFNNLRAAGAPLKMILPWENCTMVNSEGQTYLESKEIEISTNRGEMLTFRPIK